MSKSRLLAALAANVETLHDFTCPQTQIDLKVRVPTRTLSAESRTAAAERWGDRDVRNRLDAEEQATIAREELIARCFLCDGEAIGLDAVLALSEDALQVYDAFLQDLEDKVNPSLERMSAAEVAELFDGIKKKDPLTVARLKTFGADELLTLLLCTVALLSSSETASSSTSSGGQAQAKKAEPDPQP